MMESIKQSFVRKTSLLFILFIFIILPGCKHQVLSKTPLLECVLNEYIQSLQQKIDENTVILVYDLQGWTDSTSMIRFMLVQKDKVRESKLLCSTYKSNTIYMIQDHILSKFEYSLENSIPSGLKWKAIDYNPKIVEIPLAENFFELQLTFSIKNKCIDEIILYPVGLKHSINNNCLVCPESL